MEYLGRLELKASYIRYVAIAVFIAVMLGTPGYETLKLVSSVTSAYADDDEILHLNNQRADSLAGLKLPFNFAIIGDNRTGHKKYAKLVAMMAAEKPEFVVNVGDLTFDTADVDDWNKFVKLSAPLTMPYFIVAGNHDIERKSPKTENTFKSFVEQPGNELYYSFKAGNVLIVVMDTEETGIKDRIISDEQRLWLQNTLSASREPIKIVFLHRPMYPDKNKGYHYADSMNRDIKARDGLEAMFLKYGVGAVIAGHEHFYLRNHDANDGIEHVITGGGGAPLYIADKDGGFYHYISVRVDKDSAEFKVIDIKGKVRDEFIIKGAGK